MPCREMDDCSPEILESLFAGDGASPPESLVDVDDRLALSLFSWKAFFLSSVYFFDCKYPRCLPKTMF